MPNHESRAHSRNFSVVLFTLLFTLLVLPAVAETDDVLVEDERGFSSQEHVVDVANTPVEEEDLELALPPGVLAEVGEGTAYFAGTVIVRNDTHKRERPSRPRSGLLETAKMVGAQGFEPWTR